MTHKSIKYLAFFALFWAGGASAQTVPNLCGLSTTGPTCQPITGANLANLFGTKGDATNGIFISPTTHGGTIDGATGAFTGLTTTGGLSNANGPVFLLGNTGDGYYGLNQVVTPNSAIAVRASGNGCGDQAAAFSVILDNSFTVPGTGVSTHSGIGPGGCTSGALAAMAAYGAFDAVGEYRQIQSDAPAITLTNISYDTTHVYPATSLTSSQIATLTVGEYILTNSVDGSGRPIGSYITSWAPNGSSITVVGWIALGSGNATPIIPSTTYLAGSGSAPLTWVGQPTVLYASNEAATYSNNVAITHGQSTEFDIENNNTFWPHANFNGLSVLSLGSQKAGIGLGISNVNGLGGGPLANAFDTGIVITNFNIFGEQIVQTPGAGGVGLNIVMDTGTGLSLQTHANVTEASIDMAGNATFNGGLLVQGVAVSGYPFVIKNPSGSNLVVLDTAGDFNATGTLLGSGGLATATGLIFGNLISTAQPSCSSSDQGTMWDIKGAAGVRDQLQICLHTASNTYVWSTITSSP